MQPSPTLTLFARTPFTMGDYGWRTGNSVIPTLLRTAVQRDVALVTALEDIQPGRRGRFLEIAPEHDCTVGEGR